MTTVFQHRNETYTTAAGKIKPMILLVKTEHTHDGVKIEIKGKKNPLPFKSAVIHPSCNLDAWFDEMGHRKVGCF